MGKVIEFPVHKVNDAIFIGAELKKRMNKLGYNVSKLSEESLIDEEIIRKLIRNEIGVENIDDIDLKFLCQTLYCSKEYFTDDEARNKDILNASSGEGIGDIKVNLIKVKLQRFAEDFDFLRKIKMEFH